MGSGWTIEISGDGASGMSLEIVGDKGPRGFGLPQGGDEDQFLRKQSDEDGDYKWGWIDWTAVQDKPTEFTPEAHDLDDAHTGSLPEVRVAHDPADGHRHDGSDSRRVSYADLADVPSHFTPAEHGNEAHATAISLPSAAGQDAAKFPRTDGAGAYGLADIGRGDLPSAIGYTDEANTWGQKQTFGVDMEVHGLRVGRGPGDDERNLAAGIRALENISPDGGQPGTMNVAIGRDAMRFADSVYESAAIGDEALRDVTGSRDHNVAINRRALKFNVDSTENVAIGEDCMRASLGTHCVAIGGEEALDHTEGQGNVGIARFAGRDLETGNHNVFVGDSAGRGSDDLSYCVFIGRGAGRGIAGASDSIGIGRMALRDVIGNYNTAVGYYAMRQPDNPVSHHTAFGRHAGRYQPGDNGTSIGSAANARGEDSCAFGRAANSFHKGSTAIGQGQGTDAEEQMSMRGHLRFDTLVNGTAYHGRRIANAGQRYLRLMKAGDDAPSTQFLIGTVYACRVPGSNDDAILMDIAIGNNNAHAEPPVYINARGTTHRVNRPKVVKFDHEGVRWVGLDFQSAGFGNWHDTSIMNLHMRGVEVEDIRFAESDNVSNVADYDESRISDPGQAYHEITAPLFVKGAIETSRGLDAGGDVYVGGDLDVSGGITAFGDVAWNQRHTWPSVGATNDIAHGGFFDIPIHSDSGDDRVVLIARPDVDRRIQGEIFAGRGDSSRIHWAHVRFFWNANTGGPADENVLGLEAWVDDNSRTYDITPVSLDFDDHTWVAVRLSSSHSFDRYVARLLYTHSYEMSHFQVVDIANVSNVQDWEESGNGVLADVAHWSRQGFGVATPEEPFHVGTRARFDERVNFQDHGGASSKDPTSDAPDEWLEVELGGSVYFIPAYAAN